MRRQMKIRPAVIKFMGVVVCVLIFTMSVMSGRSGGCDGVVIDAGSTGTRLHCFEGKGADVVRERFYTTDFAFGEKGAARTLEMVLKQVEMKPGDRQRTRVFVGATEGLRKLGMTTSEGILREAKNYLEKVGFGVVTVELLPGTSEGLYAWKTVNFLTRKTEDPTGAATLDVGGGSIQLVTSPTHAQSWSGAGFNALNPPSCGTNYTLCFTTAYTQLSTHLPPQPPLPATTLYAFSYFHKFAHTLSPTTYPRFVTSVKRICEVQDADPAQCRALGYLAAILSRVGVGEETEIVIAKKVEYKGGLMETAWPLGAYLSRMSWD